MESEKLYMAKVILLNVYAAGEKKIINYENFNLEEGIRNYGHKNIESLKEDKNIFEKIFKNLKNFDIIIFLGAGNITNIANSLQEEMKVFKGKFNE